MQTDPEPGGTSEPQKIIPNHHHTTSDFGISGGSGISSQHFHEPEEIISGFPEIHEPPPCEGLLFPDYPTEKNFHEEMSEESGAMSQSSGFPEKHRVGGKPGTDKVFKKKKESRAPPPRSYSQDTPVTQKQSAPPSIKSSKKAGSRRVTPERDTRSSSLETHMEDESQEKTKTEQTSEYNNHEFSDGVYVGTNESTKERLLESTGHKSQKARSLNKSSILGQMSRNIKGLVKSLPLPSNDKKERKSKQSSKKISTDKPLTSPKIHPSTPLDSSSPHGDAAKYDFSKIPLPPIREEGGEHKELYERLKDFFLSPEASTEIEREKNSEVVPEINNDILMKILLNNVEDIDNMLDRSGSTPVSLFIVSTYQNGLPLLSSNEVLQKHTIHAVKVIFHKAPSLPESTRKPLFRRLAEAYTACQMEQCRVIDSIFGIVTGRDLSLGQQVLSLVDIQKEQVLNQVVNYFNPDAWKTSDDNPRGQVPHIQSSYCIAIGGLLGLRGVSAAYMDRDAFEVQPENFHFLLECFKRLFSVQDLINTLISDINQQDEGANRLVNCNSLTQWAGDTSQNNGFPSHSIFYDEDNAEAWPKELGIPKEENKYNPFINNTTALKILEHLFLFKKNSQ